MSSSVQAVNRAGRRRLLAAVVLALVAMAMAMTVGLGWAGAGRDPSGSVVRSGWPMAWAVQDQSALSPPGGASTSGRLLSPWEHPTHVDGGSLAVDGLAIGVCLLGVAGVRTVLKRRRTRRP